jgi:hypothetical protein
MSTVEERLLRDIAAVTGGVEVTESELTEARDVLDERIEGRRRRDRHRILGAVAAAAVVITVAGFLVVQTLNGDDKSAPPVEPGPTKAVDPYAQFLGGAIPTAHLLEGVWRVDNGTVLVHFSAANEMAMDNGGRLFADPDIRGTYRVTDDLITLRVEKGPADCLGQTLAMRASVTERGVMHFVHTQPGQGDCAPEFTEVADDPGSYDDVSWGLEQVLPTKNAFLRSLENDANAWTKLTQHQPLLGDWMAEGGGQMLELTRGGGYAVVAGSGDVVDRGHWSRQARTLTLTSSGASPSCAAGDRLVLAAMKYANTGAPSVRGTVEENGCGGAWATTVWILLPQNAS